MNLEEVLEIADTLVLAKTGKHLSNLQKSLLGASLSESRKTYDEIAKTYGYSGNYLKTDAGPKLWHLLSEVCGEKVKKTNVKGVIERKKQLLYPITFEEVTTNSEQNIKNFPHHWASKTYQDWGDSPGISVFYDRTSELAQLKHWIAEENCRLVAITGMGGIGKTYLSVKLAQEIQEEFKYIFWRSLVHAPPLIELLTSMLNFLTHGEERNLPVNIEEKISYLIAHLSQHRCLLVLDNVETILCCNNSGSNYQKGYENYGNFFKSIGESYHHSCLTIISREKPKEIILMQGSALPIRSLQLKGLNSSAIYKLLQLKGCKLNSEEDGLTLTEKYAGNPLALNLVASIIHELFQGNASEFLKHNTLVFDEIRTVLDRQFYRLSYLSQELLYWLAIYKDGISLEKLRTDMPSIITFNKILENIKSLAQSSLIVIAKEQLLLSPVLREYLLEKLKERAEREIRAAMETRKNKLCLSPVVRKYLLEKLSKLN